MRYFNLISDSDPKTIGVRNGVHQGEIKWSKFLNDKVQMDILEYFSLEKYRTNMNEVKPYDFEIEYVEAYKSAKLTDFFTFTPRLWGIEFLITENVKALLDKFCLPVHTYIPAQIYKKGKSYQYWALYIPYTYRLDSIDFKNTIFFKGSELSGKEYLQFDNVEDWNKNKVFGVEKLCLNNNFKRTLNLFKISFGGGGYYISESLKEAIGKAELTGIVIKEPKEPELIIE